jgi:hypothetical protein
VQHIFKKFRRRFGTRNQQMIASARTGDVEQMALSVVDILKVGIVSNGQYA